MPEVQRSTIEELSRFFAPAYVREEVEKLRGWQHQLALDTSFGRVISTPTWISGVSIQNKTVDAEKLNVGELKAITAYTGSLVVSGAAANPAGGQLTVAADPNSLLVSSITFRAVADANNIAGMTFRNASGTKTVEMKLDGSGQIGAGTAITWDTNGVVSVPSGLITGGITITNVSSGTFGGDYEISNQTTQGSGYDRIRLDRTRGIGIFKAGVTEDANWNNAVAAIRRDGSAKFTGGLTIEASYTSARLKLNTTDGILFENASTNVPVFSLNTSGVLRIRRAVIGSTGTPGSGERIEISDSEIAGFGASGATFRLGTDGSGYIKAGGSSTNAIQWSNAGVTINADTITVNNLSVSKVTSGTFGGTYEPSSTNRLVWTKTTNGTPMSYISPDQLWVETTTNQARFTQTARDGSGNITDASALDIFQQIFTGPPKIYYATLRLRYGSAFTSGAGVLLYRDVSTGGNYARLEAGKAVEVSDINTTVFGPLNITGLLSAQADAFLKNNVTVDMSTNNGTHSFQVKNPDTVLLAIGSNGTLYYRGATTTSALGTYQGSIQATVKFGSNEVAVKIPCYA